MKVISFRNHHHAFDPSDPSITFIGRAKPLTAPRRLLQFVFSWTMIHYFLWIFPMIGLIYGLYAVGLWYLSVLLLALYIPTFLNNDQYKSGRPWHALRSSPLWRLTSRYIGAEVIRTKKLDPTKRYMFGLYPHGQTRKAESSWANAAPLLLQTAHAAHSLSPALSLYAGILILSRVAIYGLLRHQLQAQLHR